MKKQYLFSLLISILHLSISALYAQPKLLWARQMGGDDYTSAPSDRGKGIVTDVNGNVYTAGDFKGKADFNPGTENFFIQSSGGTDAFISKLNSAGEFVWAKNIGGSQDQTCNDLVIDHQGYLYITGSIRGTSTFPSVPTQSIVSSGLKDAYVCKLDTSGRLIWVRVFAGIQGSNDQNEGMAVAVDRAGNVYTVGQIQYSSGGIDLDPGQGTFYVSSSGGSDIFISKLNSEGEFVWGKRIGNQFNEKVNDLAVNETGALFFTGSFYGKVDFDPGDGTYFMDSRVMSNQDAFICKLDTDANFKWSIQIGNNSNSADIGNALTLDPFGNLIVAGLFSGNVDFDPDTSQVFNLLGNSSSFIVKYSSAGRMRWARHFTGRNNTFGIDTDRRGQIYLTGEISSGNSGPTDLDPGPGTFLINLSYNSPDIYIAKLDSSGGFITGGSMGGLVGVALNKGIAVCADAEENLYVTGEYVGTTPDFDPDPIPTAVFYLPTKNMDDEQIFIAKYGTLSKPVADFGSDTRQVCAGACIAFQNKSLGADSWEWFFEGAEPQSSTSENPGQICYADTGNFSVRLIAERDGIKDTLIRNAYITSSMTDASFSYSADNMVYSFEAVQDSLNGISYLWSFGDRTTATSRNPVHTYEITGQFEVCLEVSQNGLCKDSSCSVIDITVTSVVELTNSAPKFIPTLPGIYCADCKESDFLVEVYDLTGRLLIAPKRYQLTDGIILLPEEIRNERFVLFRMCGERESFTLKIFNSK